MSVRKGDYCRYMAEYKTGEGRDKSADKASEAYKEAQNLATKDDSKEDGEVTKEGLPSTHPIRLGLVPLRLHTARTSVNFPCLGWH